MVLAFNWYRNHWTLRLTPHQGLYSDWRTGMRVPIWLRARLGRFTRAKLRREATRFLAKTANCLQTQQQVLERLLTLNADSQFSREYHLNEVRTPADFRARLPIADYEFYRPYIDQLKVGNQTALLGRNNKLLMFGLSSGTTSESKYIPITEQFFDDYRRGWQIWGILAFDAHSELHRQNIVQLSSNHDRFRTSSGTPCGNISGLAASMQRSVVRSLYTIPSIVSKITDPDAKYYTALRLALTDESVGMLTTANPSTLLHLAQFADAHRQLLIRDIADGTLSDEFHVSQEIRQRLTRKISRKNRRRARHLESIVQRTGQLYPRDFWPGMNLLAIWTAGSCGCYLRLLERYYGDVPIRDHGLSASEGRMTIPLEDGRSDGVLEIDTHYFEFIPEFEYGNENPTVLEAHELKQDANYYILLTTSSGLYRYDICDVVCCVGFYKNTPLLRFLHKGAHISNITGEKVSESQVIEAVRNCVDQMRINIEYFAMVPVWNEPPQYQLLIEQRDLPSGDAREDLAQQIEDQLKTLNCEYREKRQTGRLAPMKVVPLRNGTWKEFSRKRQSNRGGSVEQYKHPCLIPNMQIASQILDEYAVPMCEAIPKYSVKKVTD